MQIQGTSFSGGVMTEPDPSRKGLHLLTVLYKPEEGTSRGDLHKVFRVITDLPGEPPVEVAVTLHVEP